MRFRRENEDDSPQVDLTPMIDCVFLLLIFFLVTSQVKAPMPMLDLELPIISYADAAPQPQAQLVLGIDARGQVYAESNPVDRQQLRLLLERAAYDDPPVRIRIDLDRATPGEHLLEVLNLCRLFGLRQISFGGRN